MERIYVLGLWLYYSCYYTSLLRWNAHDKCTKYVCIECVLGLVKTAADKSLISKILVKILNKLNA